MAEASPSHSADNVSEHVADDRNSADETVVESEESVAADPSKDDFDAADQFRLIKNYFDKKISTLTNALHVSDTHSGPSQPRLNKKSHQDQVDFNTGLIGDIGRVQVLLKSAWSRKRALDILDSTEKSLKKRQKLIKLADRSQGGWDTVAAYLPDDLASNSEDERRIRQADKKGIAIRKEKNQGRRPTDNKDPRSKGKPAYSKPKTSRNTDKCNYRGIRGHWSKDCRKKQAARYEHLNTLSAQTQFVQGR